MPRARSPEPEHRRTGEPVRKNSRLKGRCELGVWRPFDRRRVPAHLQAAERYDIATKKPGARYGALGVYGVRVLRELLRLVDFKTGRLEPSISTLQLRLRLSRTAVVRALRMLQQARFVDWVRRFEPSGIGRGVRGPQVKQATNAYGLLDLPKAAANLLRGPPEPADHAVRRHALAEELRAMEGDARRQAAYASPALGAALARGDLRFGVSASPPNGKKPTCRS